MIRNRLIRCKYASEGLVITSYSIHYTKLYEGKIQAGATLTFDQYRNDQIVALSYDHSGDRKRQGLTIQDRPDTLSDLVKEAYRAIEGAATAAIVITSYSIHYTKLYDSHIHEDNGNWNPRS